MATVAPTAAPATSNRRKLSLSDATTTGRNLPSIVILQGVEGIGKSSMFSHAPNPVVLPTETGMETLLDAGQIRDITLLPRIDEWLDALDLVEELRTGEHEHKTLILDVMDGFEKLCFAHVCRTLYKNDWGAKGFMAYRQGPVSAMTEWRLFLKAMERLREERRMAIVCLCHTAVRNFKNPEGPDYDRYVPAMEKETWEVSKAWADIVLFYNYETVLQDNDTTRKTKAKGGTVRRLYMERTAAWDAKNRHGLPPEIAAGDSSQEAYNNFVAAMKTARNGGK
jgi:hypothetical protein